jgi:hypothetical protein
MAVPEPIPPRIRLQRQYGKNLKELDMSDILERLREPWLANMMRTGVNIDPHTIQRGKLNIEAADEIERLRAEVERLLNASREIVGYIVFRQFSSIDTAALYPLSQEEAASEAAKRWDACMSAVVLHPDSPSRL